MSELPQIDAQKSIERLSHKFAAQLAESVVRESNLELLAEALRDERDALRERVTEVENTASSEVHTITDVTAGS